MPSRDEVRIVNADARAALSAMPPASVDAVVTDPPWNLGKEYRGHDDAMPIEGYVEWLGAILRECARVARGAVVYLPGAVNRRTVDDVLARAQLRLAGVVTWFKPEPEPIVWAVGRRDHARAPAGAVHALEPPAGNAAVAGHPCPKPQRLMRFLIEAAVPPAGTVLDPFAGTGTTLVAARQAGRSAVGIEVDGRYCKLARRRVQRLEWLARGTSRDWVR